VITIAIGLIIAVALASPPSVAPAQTSPSSSGSVTKAVDNMRTEYLRLETQTAAAGSMSQQKRAALLRRISWGYHALDGDPFTSHPEVEPEKQEQLTFDRDVVDNALAGVALPIVGTPGPHEAVLNDPTSEPVAYFVPTQKPEHMLILLPGEQESETDVISRTALQQLAEKTRTLLVVPGLDGARTLDDVAQDVSLADGAFAPRYRFDATTTYLGGVSAGASLQFEVPQRLHRGFAGYLAIDGTLPGSSIATLLRAMSRGSAAIYFVSGEHDKHVPASAVRASVSRVRAAGVPALYYEQPAGVASVDSLAPAIGRAWTDMMHGVTKIPNDGLGGLPGDQLPAGVRLCSGSTCSTKADSRSRPRRKLRKVLEAPSQPVPCCVTHPRVLAPFSATVLLTTVQGFCDSLFAVDEPNRRDQLVELCGFSGALLIDIEGIYDPRSSNDRLVTRLERHDERVRV